MKAGWLTPHSLRGRLSRGLALQAALGLGVVCAAVYIVIACTLSIRQDEVLAQKQAAIQHVLREGRGAHAPGLAQHLLDDVLAGHRELSLRMVDGTGRALYEDPRREPPPGSATKRLDFEASLPNLAEGAVQAALVLDTGSDDALLRRLGWTLALAALLGTGAIAACGVWLVGRGLAPLGQLVDQTRQVSALRLDRRLDGRGQAQELQPLIAQFNALLDELAGAYGQMESFNADVAHELNTPLATLIGSCELALRRPRGQDELCDVIASNLEELHRMAGIVGDMLFLSNAERGATARRTPQDSLARLAQEVIEFHEAALYEAGLAAEVQGDAQACVDAPLLRRALSNLLGNATRYGLAGSAVVVQIRPFADGSVELAVRNQGPAIGEQHLPRLFERFYRADPARADADRNHGLGLSIVAGIARMHGGTAFAESASGITRVGLRLPEYAMEGHMASPSGAAVEPTLKTAIASGRAAVAGPHGP
ncbi:heavy metal sensor histidine kinase [Paracidovorax avenae]|uniref:heavy metal sensor histidine kinase n=1 Tax=Paracidovorax avenae TaxID=80867 RepID=UPI000D1623C3|nr:heavy metal sensor histidine kinase [Paracidovorax avenae]AVS87044.1 two-component sensor histidine kinase [Paracidovorax avenae]AVS94874.1 two-component sensor histidine kinase [Paracidovorax avenae]AVT01216.1 two-component sensor histidine kinase [Paracidovorax avenae]AVT08291.1 two-component sensor histidine kinase [Paracidovorax avenae]